MKTVKKNMKGSRMKINRECNKLFSFNSLFNMDQTGLSCSCCVQPFLGKKINSYSLEFPKKRFHNCIFKFKLKFLKKKF